MAGKSKIKNYLKKKWKSIAILSLLNTGFLIYCGYKIFKKIKKFIQDKLKLKLYSSNAKVFIENRNQKLIKFSLENSMKFNESQKNEIEKASLTTLKNFLESKKYTSEEITTVLLIRNSTIGIKLGCIADVNIEETVNYAKRADEIYDKYFKGEISYEKMNEEFPLLGLPITFKDNLGLKSFLSTCGYLTNLDKICQDDSDLVYQIKQKGGVPLLTTNLHQGLLSLESNNDLFGRSLNPFDESRTPGGSSGGEAGLIASYCSPGGFGGDLAGSIRVPSAFCGLYGFKGTSTRSSLVGGLPPNNTKTGNPGFLLKCANGPITRTLEDLLLLTKNSIGGFRGNDSIFNVKFNQQSFDSTVSQKKFRIGYFSNLKLVKVTDPIENAIKDIVQSLKNEKEFEFEIIEFPTEMLDEFHLLTNQSVVCSRGYNIIKKVLDFENCNESYSSLEYVNEISNFKRWIYVKILKLLGKNRESIFLENSNPNKSIEEYLDLLKRIEDLKIEINSMWNELQLDGLICPVLAHPAFQHDLNSKIIPMACYNVFFNFLDFPCLTFPVRKVGKSNLKFEDQYNDSYTKTLNKILSGSENLPIGLQLVTPSNTDEKCFGLMNVIEQVLKKSGVMENLFSENN